MMTERASSLKHVTILKEENKFMILMERNVIQDFSSIMDSLINQMMLMKFLSELQSIQMTQVPKSKMVFWHSISEYKNLEQLLTYKRKLCMISLSLQDILCLMMTLPNCILQKPKLSTNISRKKVKTKKTMTLIRTLMMLMFKRLLKATLTEFQRKTRLLSGT